MKSNTLTDPLDTSDGLFNAAGDGIFVNLSPPAAAGGGSPFPNSVPVIVPEEAAQAETAVAASGSGGAGSVVAETSGSGFTVNLLFDAAAMAAPASFRAGIEQAASILAATISDKITVNIKIDYSGTGGGAAAGPDIGQYESYSSIRADLINNATPGDPTFNALPSGSTVQGQSSIAVWNAQLKLFGLVSANSTTTDDGSATFSTDINSNLLVGVALHELTHAMGRVPYGAPYSSSPDIFDLYRFTSPGTVLINGASTAPAAYFSVDGGNTKIADFGQNSDSSDFLNSGVQGGNDPFNEYYTGSTLQSLTTADKEMLDALGFHTTASVTTTVIEALGSTSLVVVGTNYYLDSISTGTGPMLKYGGSPQIVGAAGSWSPIGAEATSTGYDVAWKDSVSGQYSIWSTDSSGNFISFLTGAVSGAGATLESYEPLFHQDLNGDGVIGVPVVAGSTTIESLGSTSLIVVGTNYYLDSISTGTGPMLKYGGAPQIVGAAGSWSPFGAEATSTGYDVAWKDSVSGQYSIWSTDSNGNFQAYLTGAVSGTSAKLESYEAIFHQDLNGDGLIGLPANTSLIEAFGSTSLVVIGTNYFLQSNSTGTGPTLKYGGSAQVVGAAGTWSPIGAEATSTGYDVAWKDAASGQFSIWSTDSNGNFQAYLTGAVVGTGATLESYEPILHQDLNGDGVIGVPAATSSQPASVSQAAAVTVVNNDTFVFKPGIGADVVANAGSASTIELDGFSSVTSDSQLAALLHEAQASQPQALFHPTPDGHGTVISLGNQDSITLTNIHIADLHASNFIIG
jgi:serralysin